MDLKRLCRYLLRPALAVPRLTRSKDGRYRYGFKAPCSDGTVALIFEPMESVERLVALVPPARANGVRYHGILAQSQLAAGDLTAAPPRRPLLAPP